MNTMLKRIISLLLCLVLTVGYMPVSVLAAENDETIVTETTEPSTEATEPSTEATEPSTEATEPSSEATDPSTEATVPSAGVAKASLETEDSALEETDPAVIAVTGITLDRTALEAVVGQLPETLYATVLPEDATDKTVTWTSSEPGVASVKDGVLTFGYMGTTTITATAGEFSASCTVTVGEVEVVAYDLDKVVDAAVFFSDLHAGKPNGGSYTSKESTLKNVMNAAKATELPFSTVTSVGDLFAVNKGSSDGTSLTAAQADKDMYTGYIQSVLGAGVDCYYTWSDHDRTSDIEDYTGLLYGDNGTADTTADDKNYYIYAISMSDTSTDDRYNTGVFGLEQETLESFTTTMERLDPSKPVFIASHQPLVATSRKDNGNAYKWFEVINEAAEDHDIVFFWGHNHKYDAAEYYCYEVGDDMPVQNGSSSVTEEDINFSHICTGYLDPTTTNSNGQTRTGTILVVSIGEEEIAVTTYDSTGVYEKTNALDVTVKRDHAEAEEPAPTDPAPEETVIPEGYALARVEVVNQGTTKYFLNDALDTEGLAVEAVYTKEGAADVRKAVALQTGENQDGYTVTCDMSKPGKQYVTVTYGGFTGSFAIEVYETHFENEAGTVAVDFGSYGITSVAITEAAREVEGYSAYVTYDITPVGYTQGDEATVTVTLDTALFDVTRPVKVLDQGAVIATPEIVEGKITFTTNHFSEYDVTQVDNSEAEVDASKWKEVIRATDGTTTYTYTRVNSITAGGEYVIVANNAGYALDYTVTESFMGSSVSMTSDTVNVSSDGATMTSTSELTLWEFSNASSGTISTQIDGDTYYLRYNNGFSLNTQNTELSFAKNNSGNNFTISYYRSSGSSSNRGNYYFYYNSDWTASSRNSTQYVRLYQLTGSETTGGTGATYGQVVGNTSYQVNLGTSEAAALQAVKNGMTVYYTTDNSSTVGLPFDDDGEGMSWTIANYNPNTAGTYTVTIKYNNVTLGTATVEVLARTATSVTLDKYEGTVERESGATVQTGAMLTVVWEDGETEQIPVTVGMLSGNLNANKNGTYSGLTVSYGGKTFENFTLKVVNKTGVDDFPQYPNPGSIDMKKTATGVDFQNTGVARVELSTSGLPASIGVDVVVVLDTGSSMEGSRLTAAKSALSSMLNTFMDATQNDGADIDVAVVGFNGFNGTDFQQIPNASLNNSYRTTSDSSKIYTSANGAVNTAVFTNGQHNLDATDFLSSSKLTAQMINTMTGYISAGSGTNYDVAFASAYRLLAAKKAANTSERQQFVVFMSDGAGFLYNGFMSSNSASDGTSDGRDTFNRWLTGEWESVTDLQNAIDNPDWNIRNNSATVRNAIKQQAVFYNGNGTTHPHRIAEAIKGAEGQKYTVVGSGFGEENNYMAQWDGLGAKIYSIGLEMKDDSNDGTVTVETLKEVIEVLSSGAGYHFADASEQTLTDAFAQIAAEIKLAATNARFVDQMGDSFNLQMDPIIKTNAQGSGGTDDTNTDITITARPVYTREQVGTNVGGHNVTTDDIGKPYGDGTTLETVAFQVADDGSITATTSAGGYTIPDGNGGTQTVTAGTTNILVGGVLYGKNFFFNNNNTAVTVTLANGSTYSLPGETFYWNIGTINETMYTISYTVYLEGVHDKKEALPSDSYATNNFAILYYTNHEGNEVYKSVASPTIAWKGANVSYAFYLVNDLGQPVHADGSRADNFLLSHKLTQPVVYQSVEFNDNESAYLSAEALAVLPNGYELFDKTATYQVWVGSGDGQGANVSRWLIEGTNTLNTTYVVGFGDANDYSNERNVQNDNEAYEGYDYTHTTVYFAVKWTMGTVQDTVVIDYGLPVDISVMANDMFGEKAALNAVGLRDSKPEDVDYTESLRDGFSTSVDGLYGTATLNNGKVRYTPTSMQMKGAEKLAYAVDYDGEINKGFYYGDITVIPATTVYYEDEFVTLTTYKDKTYKEVTYAADSDKTISYYEQKEDGSYRIVLKPVAGNKYYITDYTVENGWPVNSVAANGTQAEDRPGFYNLPTVDANNIYGYDAAYGEMSAHSMGNAAMIHVDADNYGTAEFTFYGTGFDVISTTSNATGTFGLQIYEGAAATGTPVVSKAVDTYYGYVYGLYTVTYKKNADGIWELSYVGDPTTDPPQTKDEITAAASKDATEGDTVSGPMYTWKPVTNDPNALYQVPVITHSGLPYGQYTVKLSALYYSAYDVTTNPGYDLYLDAIRIYNPAGNTYGEDGNIDDDIQKVYTADGEAWPSYHELRNLIISAGTFDSLGDDEEVKGIVFIDGDQTLGEGGTVSGSAIGDYTNYGPNNELYLASGQAVAFTMNMGSANDHEGYVPVVRIGMKTVGGKTAVAELWNAASDGKRYNAISEDLATATDMYYDITVLNDRTVVIKNSGEDGSILSITNIKLTYKPTTTSVAGIAEPAAAVNSLEETAGPAMFTISRSAANAALLSLATAQEIPGESIPDPSVPETTEPEVTEPEETVPEEPAGTRLQAAVDAAKKLREKDYTQKSYRALKTALKSAEKVLKDKKATEAKIEAALEALNAAVEALEVKPDTTELKAAVDAAKKLKEKDYTAVSYKTVTTARKAAEKVLKDKNATQSQVNDALETLNAAVEALEAKADTTALKAAVNAAKKLKEKNYTSVSYKAAEKVMKDKNANQEAADAALEALNAAMEALEARANTAALKAAVNAAKKLKSKNYTQESFQAVTAARKAAEKLMKDKNANQAMADEALAALNEAMDALVAKPGK